MPNIVFSQSLSFFCWLMTIIDITFANFVWQPLFLAPLPLSSGDRVWTSAQGWSALHRSPIQLRGGFWRGKMGKDMKQHGNLTIKTLGNSWVEYWDHSIQNSPSKDQEINGLHHQCWTKTGSWDNCNLEIHPTKSWGFNHWRGQLKFWIWNQCEYTVYPNVGQRVIGLQDPKPLNMD